MRGMIGRGYEGASFHLLHTSTPDTPKRSMAVMDWMKKREKGGTIHILQFT